MAQIDSFIAYRDVLTAVGATNLNRPTTTEEAVALFPELDATKLKHGPKVAAAVKAWNAKQAQKAPTERRALTKHLNDMSDIEDDLWDGLEGEVVQGVTIIRRRHDQS